MINEQHIKQVFATYTNNYNPNDPKIALKISHTYRVAEMCREIAKSINMNEEEQQIAWAAGMLHDIGRFEQIRIYNTFIDAISVDHAEFGADLLFTGERFISSFIEDRQYDTQLEIAIREQNKFRVREGLDDKTHAFCDILRDADKIDIFRVNIETPMEEIYNTTSEAMKNAQVSEKVMEQVQAHQTVTRDVRKSAIDSLIGHMALTFELVFPLSRKLALEQGYLMKLFEFQSDNEVTKKAIIETKNEVLGFLNI